MGRCVTATRLHDSSSSGSVGAPHRRRRRFGSGAAAAAIVHARARRPAEAALDGSQSDVEYDEESKTVRVPLSAMDGGRRTKLVMFTCNKCGAPTF